MDQTVLNNQDGLGASLLLDAIIRAYPGLLFYMDLDGRILDFRSSKTSALYSSPERFLGYTMREILPKESIPEFERALQETIKTGKVVPIEYRLPNETGERWIEARLVRLENDSHLIAFVHDVSARVRNNERIQSQLSRLYAIHAADAAISASFDLKVTLSVILRQMINQLGADAADVLVLNQKTRLLEFAAGQGFQVDPQPSPVMIGQGYAGKAALERRTISVPNPEKLPSNSLSVHDPLQEKFANYYAVPLMAKGEVKGVLEIYHRSLLPPDDDWLDFLATMAGQTALAIDSACLFQDLQRTNLELNLAYDTAIESWAQMLELSNRESGAHAYRVVDLTIKLARAVGIAEKDLIHYRRGALLHDVGKLGIPESILNKPGPLDDAEWKIMKTHPLLAYQLLSPVDYLTPALEIPHYHHERWDGSGYPEGLREERIPFPARLFAVVDVFDALTSTRPYRPATSRQAALTHIQQSSGKLFDPAIVKVFLQAMR